MMLLTQDRLDQYAALVADMTKVLDRREKERTLTLLEDQRENAKRLYRRMRQALGLHGKGDKEFDPNQPRVPAGSDRGGEWAATEIGGRITGDAHMKTITSLREIVDLASGRTLYLRWSRGPDLDKKQGRSFDQVSRIYHNGLSAQNIRVDDPELLVKMVQEYQFLRGKDEKIYPWIFYGVRNGTDSDNAPTIDALTIKPLARISDDFIKKATAYNTAYWAWQKKGFRPGPEKDAALRAWLQFGFDPEYTNKIF